MGYLEGRDNALKMEQQPPSKQSNPWSGNIKFDSSSNPSHISKKTHRAASFHTKDTNSCPICDASSHNIYQCAQLKEMSADQQAVVQRAKLCNNCLAGGHFSWSCHSKNSCRECGRRYHTLLHQVDATPTDAHSDDQDEQLPTPTMSRESVLSNLVQHFSWLALLLLNLEEESRKLGPWWMLDSLSHSSHRV